MDLDWCSEEDIKNTQLFNDISIISSKTKENAVSDELSLNNINEINVESCFNINTKCKSTSELLTVMNYLSNVSNHLRTLIKNKSIKKSEMIDTELCFISEKDFNSIISFQEWLVKAAIDVKQFFCAPHRKDNSFDPDSVKPFKTSSYKFCNFKQSCSIHRNKTKTCDKNHFVFDMIINDISKLIRSLKNLGVTNLNNVFDNKIMKMTWNSELETYNIEETTTNQVNNLETEFIVDKILIFKSFDVSSYVLNKMYEESLHFLKFNVSSCQINL
jgi:hypothetical protein